MQQTSTSSYAWRLLFNSSLHSCSSNSLGHPGASCAEQSCLYLQTMSLFQEPEVLSSRYVALQSFQPGPGWNECTPAPMEQLFSAILEGGLDLRLPLANGQIPERSIPLSRLVAMEAQQHVRLQVSCYGPSHAVHHYKCRHWHSVWTPATIHSPAVGVMQMLESSCESLAYIQKAQLLWQLVVLMVIICFQQPFRCN